MSTFPPLRDIKSKLEADLNVYGLRRKIQNLETPPVKIGYGYFTASPGKAKVNKMWFIEYEWRHKYPKKEITSSDGTTFSFDSKADTPLPSKVCSLQNLSYRLVLKWKVTKKVSHVFEYLPKKLRKHWWCFKPFAEVPLNEIYFGPRN